MMKPDNWCLMSRPMELVPYILEAGFVEEGHPVPQRAYGAMYFKHPDYEDLIKVIIDDIYQTVFQWNVKEMGIAQAYAASQRSMRRDFIELLKALRWISEEEFTDLMKAL